MTTVNLETEHILDFNGNYKLAKCPPKEDGYYMTVKCGLGGIYTCLNEWTQGKWMVLSTDDSDVIAYSKEQVSKEDVENWANAKMDKRYKQHIEAKKASLKKHKKRIRNIVRNAHPLNFFGIRFYEPGPKDLKRIRNHKYMINKIKREIDNMKNHFKNK